MANTKTAPRTWDKKALGLPFFDIGVLPYGVDPFFDSLLPDMQIEGGSAALCHKSGILGFALQSPVVMQLDFGARLVTWAQRGSADPC